MAELRRLLHRSRLITLTGPGGAGKSRLALRLAGEVQGRYPDGVWLVDLAALADERLLEHTVASVCGINEDAQRPIREAIAAGISGSRVLIVLDGCEHLIDSCAAITSGLLRSCPKLSVIATSREPLGVAGEVIWRTPSLTIPRLEDAAHPELLMGSEAIRLFFDRARLGRPEFELEPAGAAALAQICTRLEGIPLAIELAAGLASVMTLEEIVERLRHRFQLLTGGSRTSLPRHQTLRQAVDWSYGLLSPTEQALFARLGVFAGGFDLAAAEAVVHGTPIEVDDVQPILLRLINKSLVVAEPGHPHVTRFRMLDTIREYALEKLQQVGEAQWRRKHADYFAEWSTAVAKQLLPKDPVASLRRLDEEHANIRLALEWSLTEQHDNALRLAAAMGYFWWMHRSIGEGFEWLSRALEVETSSPGLRAEALLARARLCQRWGDYSTARRDAEGAAAIAKRLGLHRDLARAVNILGIIASESGDNQSALRIFGEGYRLAKGAGDVGRMAASLNNIASIESELGHQGDALAHVEEALAALDSAGDRVAKAIVLETAGYIDIQLGQLDRARRRIADAILMARELEDTMTIANCLDSLGLAALSAGDANRTVVLISAARTLRTITGGAAAGMFAARVKNSMDSAKARLSKVAAESAERRGTAMSMEEAIRFALGETTGRSGDGKSRLTDRETQVAKLIATGMTNAEVAARLRISDRTVDAHVEHIRNKLGLRTRAQIAVWAHERLGDS